MAPERVDQIYRPRIQAQQQRDVYQGVRQRVISRHPHRRGLGRIEHPHGQQQHRQADALEQRLELARPGGGDHLAALVDDEEAHDGDAHLTQQKQRDDDPAEPDGTELAEHRGHDQRGAGEQLVGYGIHQLAEFGDLVVLAGHPPVHLVGGRGDDEQHGRGPSHGDVVLAPRACGDVQAEEYHDQHDARIRDGVQCERFQFRSP